MPYYPPGIIFANPTASVGLTAVNGTATTAMRSDAAPALDVTAAYAFGNLGNTVIGAGKTLTADTNTLFVDATNHRVGIGTLTPAVTLNISGTGVQFQIDSTSAQVFTGNRYAANTGEPAFYLSKARGTIASPGAIVNGDGIGSFVFRGYSNGDWRESAYLVASTDGAVSGNSVPSKLDIWLTASGETTPTIRAEFNASGRLLMPSGGALGFNSAALGSGSQDVFYTRGGAAATHQFGNANAASPVAQTLQAQGSRSGTDSNVGGANLTIQAGTGTSAGTLSSLILQSPIAVGGTTTAQTQTTGWTIKGGQAVASTYTVAALPTGIAGGVAYVTDGDAGLAWGATVVNTGAGATKYWVWYNAANWTVMGK